MSFYKKNKTVDIFRFEKEGDSDIYGKAAIYSHYSIGIFPASNNILAIYPGELSMQLYEIFIYDYIELQNGDKFVDQTNGDEWILRGMPRVFDMPTGFVLQCVGEKVVGT